MLDHTTFEKEKKPFFLDMGPSLGSNKDYGEETAREIDSEVKITIE